MNSTRRWFQYSLRSFLVVLTAFAIWLGVIVNRAREQREAVVAIEGFCGVVFYDWQLDESQPEEPPGPRWLRQVIGNDFFHDVVEVGKLEKDSDIPKFLPHLLQFRKLRIVNTGKGVSDKSATQLQAALPQCEILLLY